MDRAVAGAVPHVRDAAFGEIRRGLRRGFAEHALRLRSGDGLPAITPSCPLGLSPGLIFKRYQVVTEGEPMSDPKKQSNLRLALILASIALVFFLSVFAKRLWLG